MLTQEEKNRLKQITGGQPLQQNAPAYSWGELTREFRGTGKNLFEDAKSSIERMSQNLNNASFQKGNVLESGKNVALESGGLAAGMLGNIVTGVGAMMLPENMERDLKERAVDVMYKYDIPQQYEMYQKHKATLPEQERLNLEASEAGLEGMLEVLGAGTLFRGGKFVGNALESTVDSARNVGGRVRDITPPVIRQAFRQADPVDRDTAIRQASNNIKKAVVEDKTGVNNQLDKAASRARRLQGEEGQKIDRDFLLDDMVSLGIYPGLDGKLLDFSKSLDATDVEIGQVSKQIESYLKTVPSQNKLDDLKREAIELVRNDKDVTPDLKRIENRIEAIFEGQSRAGSRDSLDSVDLLNLSKQMNRRYKENVTREEFEVDAETAIGRVARDRIDNVIESDSVRSANAYLSQLYRAQRTAEVLQNKKVDAGEVAKTLGSFGGTVGAAGIGFSVGGPGGLVVAGLAARMGSEAVASALRNMKFGSANRQRIIDGIKRDPVLVQKLINEADARDKEILATALLPEKAGGETVIQAGPRGSTGPDATSVRAVEADRQSVRGEGGQFDRGFTSEPRGTEKARQELAKRLNESSPNDTPDSLKNNKQAGFADFLAPFRGDPRKAEINKFIKEKQAIANNTSMTQKQRENARIAVSIAKEKLSEL